jgi:5'(3')-deoxyribonucleotidase
MKTIGIDMDSTMADFDKGFQAAVLGLGHGYEENGRDLRSRIIGDRLSDEDRKAIVSRILCQEGFWYNLEPIEGAKKAIKKLRKQYDLYVVSAPWVNSKTCVREKIKWAQNKMGFDSSHIVLTAAKHMVKVDILLDDYILMVNTFPGSAILFERNHNKDSVLVGSDKYRAGNWEEVVKIVESIAELRRGGAYE